MLNMWCFVLLMLYTIIARGIIILSPSRIKICLYRFRPLSHPNSGAIALHDFIRVTKQNKYGHVKPLRPFRRSYTITSISAYLFFLHFTLCRFLKMYLNTLCTIIRYFRSMLSLLECTYFFIFRDGSKTWYSRLPNLL